MVYSQRKQFIARQLFNLSLKYSLRGLRWRETTGTNILDEIGIRNNCSHYERVSCLDARPKFIKHFRERRNNSLVNLHNILLYAQS